MLLATPLDPDAPEARRWLEDELQKPEYQNAKPTAFDLAMQAIRDWIADLLGGAGGVPGPVVTLIVVLVIVALVVVAFLVFGLPRLRRARRTPLPLFDDHDVRDLGEIRAAADAAARAGDWPRAIEERFRALVRGIVDRDLVQVHPGTTAGAFADAAARPFPSEAGSLASAAAAFDDVRYSDGTGDVVGYDELTRLERRIAETRPTGAADVEAEAVR